MINKILTSKPGKHGIAKYNFVGVNLITKKSAEVIIPGRDKIMRCKVIKNASLVRVDKRSEQIEFILEGDSTIMEVPFACVPSDSLSKVTLYEEQADKTGGEVIFKYAETPTLLSSTISLFWMRMPRFYNSQHQEQRQQLVDNRLQPRCLTH